MKKRNTVVSAAAAILFVTVIIAGAALFVMFKSKTQPKETSVKIYYYDPISMELVPERVKAKLPESETLKIRSIVDLLKKPGSNGLFPVLNKNATLNSVTVKNGICTLDFDKSIQNIEPYSVRKEAIRVYGIVNTITELPEINAVLITINSEKKPYLSRYIEIDKPLTHLASTLPSGKDVFVYYGSPDMSKLIVDKRNIPAVQNPTELGKEILNELLHGPFGTTLPKGTKINDFYIKSGGVGVVDFNEEILKNPLGSQGEQIRVLAVVNSLTELPDINSVRFLVNGKEINTLYGSVDTSQPVPRFMGIENDKNTIIPYYTTKINGTEYLTPQITETNKKDKFKALFDALKSPPEGYGSLVTNETKLLSYKLITGKNTLILEISAQENPDNTKTANILNEIALSYLEIPEISEVDIYINGEKYICSR